MSSLYKEQYSASVRNHPDPIAYSVAITHWLRGYTSLELAVTLSVAGLLLSLATPSFLGSLQKNRITAVAHHLYHDLYLARSTAITRGIAVTVCKSSNGSFCTTQDDWEQGWIVFEDRDRDRVIGDRANIIGINQGRNESVSIRYSGFGARSAIVYLPTGTSNFQTGTFTFCDSRGVAHAKALILHRSGRLRFADTRSDGSPLSCS